MPIQHELAHIRRKDYLVNLVQSFAEVVFFFNPALLWISSLLREERENCCDEVAISHTNDKKQFIHALVAFQEYATHTSNKQPTIAFAGRKNYLLNRVKRIIYNENKKLNAMFGDLHIDKTGTIQPAGQRMLELIEEIKLMDEVGLDFYGIGEHHRPDYAVSTPEIILAAAASVTKKIKLGSAVSVISSADPVKLYQSFATIDLLSNGRAELMAGRGSFIESFPLFGYNLQDYDALFEEKLDLLLKIDQNPSITWKGKFRAPLHAEKVHCQYGGISAIPAGSPFLA